MPATDRAPAGNIARTVRPWYMTSESPERTSITVPVTSGSRSMTSASRGRGPALIFSARRIFSDVK